MLALAVALDAAAAAEVRLRSSAVCAAAVVRLADVAEIHELDLQLARALADVPLCPAPPSGRERQFTQQDVRQLLALSGVTGDDVVVTGSEVVAVLGEPPSGPAAAVKQPRRALATHRQVSFERSGIASRDSTLRLAAKTKAAQPTAGEVEPQPALRLVEKGALCTVNARTGPIRVTTQGKALQAGTLGDTIAVEMADTKERVLGRITGSQVVEVGVGPQAKSQAQDLTPQLLPIPVARK